MPCPHEEEWEQAAKEIGIISGKHGGDEFVVNLLVAVYKEFDRQYREWRDVQCE